MSETVSSGFPACLGQRVQVLVLGSLPGRRSIEAGEYYAHPRNAFWQLAEDLFEVPTREPYARRIELLLRRGVGLWDVLHSSERAGSLDSAIALRSAKANDFEALIAAHPELRVIAFNGRKAAELFTRLVAPGLGPGLPALTTLPSTSPAHAAMSYGEKRRQWSALSQDTIQGERA